MLQRLWKVTPGLLEQIYGRVGKIPPHGLALATEIGS